MKIKMSKSQWQNIGKKAGWMKVAGEDWMLNEQYTQQVIDELTKRGDEIIAVKDNYKITVNHKVQGKVVKGLEIAVWEMEYSNEFLLIANGNGRQLAMADGLSATEAIDNMDNQFSMIVEQLDKTRGLF